MSGLKIVTDATKDAARKTSTQTRELATAVATKAESAVASVGEAITDGWITTKVKAHFIDVTLLTNADIAVESHDHVVTLTGTAPSSAAKARAATIAEGIQGVARVVNQIAVVPV